MTVSILSSEGCLKTYLGLSSQLYTVKQKYTVHRCHSQRGSTKSIKNKEGTSHSYLDSGKLERNHAWVETAVHAVATGSSGLT